MHMPCAYLSHVTAWCSFEPGPVQLLRHAADRRLSWRRRANFQGDSETGVGLPVFTIHGNHDDPSGAENLSAVDVLSTCSLVNYFGKHVRLVSLIRLGLAWPSQYP